MKDSTRLSPILAKNGFQGEQYYADFNLINVK